MRTPPTRSPRLAWRPGDAVEVSWAPEGHPAARWEAEIISAVFTRGGGKGRAKVRYKGFGAGWDELLGHGSPRLFPAREPFDTSSLKECAPAGGST